MVQGILNLHPNVFILTKTDSSMDQLDLVLDKNEKLLWSGKPKFLPYVISRVIILGIVIFMFTFISVLLIMSHTGTNVTNRFDITYPLLLWSAIIAIVGSSILVRLWWRVAFYGVTDKRVIFQYGIFGRDFTFMDYDKIQNTNVNIGLIDKIFKTGSIIIFTGFSSGGSRNISLTKTIANIPNPYEVFKLFNRTEFDVKTDMNYPNELRPEDNPGYKTEYKPDHTDDSKD